MNTIDILRKAYSDPMLCQTFRGVFPVDKIPTLKALPSAVIVNLDTSKFPGSHWIALFFPKSGCCEYFDSYGRKPTVEILNFISSHYETYKYNNACVQDFWTVSCGQMCLYYLIWRCRGLSMKEIVHSMLSDDFIAGFIESL